MAIVLNSQEELGKASGESFKVDPIADGIYIGMIVKVEEGSRIKFNTVNDWEPCLNVEFIIYGPMGGGQIRSLKINPATGGLVEGDIVELCSRTSYKSIRPTPNFNKTGEPSAYRALLAYATGQGVTEEIRISNHEDLLGKFVGLSMIVKQKASKEGEKMFKNEIARFTRVPPFTPDEGLLKKALDMYLQIEQRRAEKPFSVSFVRIDRTNTILGDKAPIASSVSPAVDASGGTHPQKKDGMIPW